MKVKKLILIALVLLACGCSDDSNNLTSENDSGTYVLLNGDLLEFNEPQETIEIYKNYESDSFYTHFNFEVSNDANDVVPGFGNFTSNHFEIIVYVGGTTFIDGEYKNSTFTTLDDYFPYSDTTSWPKDKALIAFNINKEFYSASGYTLNITENAQMYIISFKDVKLLSNYYGNVSEAIISARIEINK